MKGGCLCKLIEYEIDLLDSPIQHCSCHTCRKAHAAAFNTAAAVEKQHSMGLSYFAITNFRHHMIRLNCSNVRFGSELDEKYMFQWAREIPGFVDWERDTLVLRSIRISESSLRELLALFWRYKIPMQQLAQFSNTTNSTWFENPAMYWYKEIFGKKA